MQKVNISWLWGVRTRKLSWFRKTKVNFQNDNVKRQLLSGVQSF